MGNIVKMNGAMSLVWDAAEEVKSGHEAPAIHGSSGDLLEVLHLPASICLCLPLCLGGAVLGTSPEPFLEFGNCTMTPLAFVRMNPTP